MPDRRRILSFRNLVIALALAMLAGLSQWLLILSQPKPPIDRSERRIPDYTTQDFTVTAMDNTGQPERRLQAAYMAHFPSDGSTEFTEPHMTVFRENEASWHIYADHGWMPEDRQQILLQSNVLIENTLATPDDALRLATEDMRVLLGEEYAETDKPVTITSQTSVTKAVGMRAYLKEGRLHLLSNVRGVYEPQSP